MNSVLLIISSFDYRHHVPVAFYVLFHLNNLFLVINSSINFIIYCSVGAEFRKQAMALLSNIRK